MIILDSSAVIDLFLATPRGKKIKEAIGHELIGVTSITVHEVLIGVKEREKEVLDDFFRAITVLPFDADASYKSIKIQASLRKKGKIMATLNLFIASICLFHNLPLFTTDQDFKNVENLMLSMF